MQIGLRRNTDACPNAETQPETTGEATQTAASAHDTPLRGDCFQSSINPPRAGNNNLHLHYMLFQITIHSDAELITY